MDDQALVCPFILQTSHTLINMSYGNRNYGGSGGRGGGYGGAGGQHRGGFGAPKPVEQGKEYAVQITELSRQGDGIARVQGFVIFVKGATAGQKVRIKITRVGDRSANGEVVTSSTQDVQQPAQTQTSQSEAAPASGATTGNAQIEGSETPKETPDQSQEKVDLRDYKTAGRQKDPAE